MEEDRESLIARIKKLEDIIESGEFTGIKKTELPIEKEEEREEIEPDTVKALPDDIKKIAESFGNIINDKNIKNPLKTVLYNAKPYYSESGNVLVLAVGEEFDKAWLEREESMELLSKVILDITGVEVEIKTKFEKEARQAGDVRMTGIDKVAPGLLTYED